MKNINRDYLIKIDVRTAKLTPAPKELKFFMTDVWTSNIFFELEPKKSLRESITNESLKESVDGYVSSENADYYTLTLRVVKPNGEPKTIRVNRLENLSFFVADLTTDFVDIPGIYQCEVFIDAEMTGEDNILRLERNTTEPFEYRVEPSIFYDLDDIIDTKILAIEDIATIDYVNSLAVGGVDLEGYVTDEELETKADKEHVHDDYVTQAVLDESLAEITRPDIDLVNFDVVNSISIKRKKYSVIGQYSTAEGEDTAATGRASHAEGDNTIASGDSSHAEGSSTTASNFYAHAEGLHSVASGEAAHAEGYQTKAIGHYSHAEGFDTVARGYYQHVQGKYNVEDASNTYAHIVGNGTAEVRANIHTLNWDGDAWFAGNITVGTGNKVLATEEYVDQVAFNGIQYDDTELLILIDNKADKDHTHDEYITREELDIIDANIDNLVVTNSISMGRAADTTVGKYSVAEGSGVTATGFATHAEGTGTKATGYASHAEGESSTASGTNSHAEGDETIASGPASHAEGYKTIANKHASHAEGDETTASGIRSHAEGYSTTASGEASHAEGSFTTASKQDSHAEGCETVASGFASHAEGSSTEASGGFSHSEGSYTVASGDYSHAEGAGAIASGDYSHAEGEGTRALSKNQHVQGAYNIEDEWNKYIHIVGNGGFVTTSPGQSELIHSNAHTLDWDGNAWFAGNVTVGADNKELVTKEYVDQLAFGDDIDLSYYVTDQELADALANLPSGGESYDDTELRGLIANKADSEHTHDEYLTEIPAEYITQTELNEAIAGNIDLTNLVVTNSISMSRAVGSTVGERSTAIGISNTASGRASHAEGWSTKATGDYSHAEGAGSTASGYNSHAEGGSTAYGDLSHAEGQGSIASGYASHAEGCEGTYYDYSSGEWITEKSRASGEGSHAEGAGSQATGHHSHAEGLLTYASGACSHAEGERTYASYDHQHVQGRYNLSGDYAHIVGNGYDADDYIQQSNCHTLDWSGNAVYAGTCTATSHPTTSDRTLKENINYISNAATINDESITLAECYDFIKDDLAIATYNYIADEDDRQKIGFIAQDLLYNEDQTDNKVGQLIIDNFQGTDMGKGENKLTYDSNNLFGVMLAAMQVMANKIEYLEQKLEELEGE